MQRTASASDKAIFSGISLAGGQVELGVNSQSATVRTSDTAFMSGSMSCEDALRALKDFGGCDVTAEGARLSTHCMYPSFEPVRVFVSKLGDGFHVHDGAGAFNVAWLHGRDEAPILKSLRNECTKFDLELADKTIVARVGSFDWLASAITSVANASSLAAHDAVAKLVAGAEEALSSKIDRVLAETFARDRYSRNVDIRGASGGTRRFDFALNKRGGPFLLINAVSPHRGSINSKYVSFADTAVDRSLKFAVHDRSLENDDTLLLQQVASVVPLARMIAGANRAWNLEH